MKLGATPPVCANFKLLTVLESAIGALPGCMPAWNIHMKTDLTAGSGHAANDIELAERVRAFPNARVLVLGDVILDRYVTGSAHRLSPEAPIPVLRPNGNRSTLGGAATWR